MFFTAIIVVFMFRLVPPACAADINIAGSGSAMGFMKMLSEEYEKSNRGEKIAVRYGFGGKGAVEAIPTGIINVAIISRPLNGKELEYNLSCQKLAESPVVIAANGKLNVSNITTNELAKILRGEISTWPDGVLIRPVLRYPDDSTMIALSSISREMKEAIEAAEARRGMTVTMTDQENLDRVETISGSLGFTALAQIISEKRSAKVLAWNDVQPSMKNFTGGRYLFRVEYYLVTKLEPPVPVRKFIQYIKSPAGEKLMMQAGVSLLNIQEGM
jgi:phosphate transport system substrate-binding protein